jgi:hypothetical protein
MARSNMPEKVIELFDLLVEDQARSDGGVTIEQIAERLQVRLNYATRAVRQLRLLWGNEKENVVCTPQGRGERWRYKLTADYDESRDWRVNRLRDALARAETMEAVFEAIASGLDGRSTEGRAMKGIAKQQRRIVEDVRELVALV